MLVMSKGGLSLGQAETYYDEKYAQDDYYSQGRSIAGQWFGRAAEALGLRGELRREDFMAVLGGLDPRTGAVLVQKAQGREERRAGWDATFSAPKSVSVQALAGGDARLIAAHREAVSTTLAELEAYAQARLRRGQEWVTTGNMVAARFDHLAARPSVSGAEKGYAPDPQLHTHVVIANMTQRPDGAWRSLEPLEIYRSQSWATALYRSRLAFAVQRLGYGIELSGRCGEWELAGYTRDHIMAFSHRRQDIEQELARRGLSGAAAAQIVAHDTRGAKDQRREEDLRAEWRERAAALGLDFARIAATPRRAPAKVEERASEARAAAAHSAKHNSERQAVIDRRAFETVALHHSMGTVILDDVRRAAREQLEHGALIEVTVKRHPGGAYTTAGMVALERDNLELMLGGVGRARFVAPAAAITAWAAQHSLSEEQATALVQTLGSTDWTVAIEGRAGSAKTTTVGALREFVAARGYRVAGFGPTTGSVRALGEAGVAARTVAALLANRADTDATPHTLWIVDESSLLASRQVNKLLHRARELGVEKVIFVGDQGQHHAVEAGRPILQMERAGLRTARLETIRRQRDPELRKAVALAAAERSAAAVALLDRQGRVAEISGREERQSAIARDYLACQRAGESALVVSPANDERRALNAAIRARLKADGKLGGQDYRHTILVSEDLTGPQRARAASYQPGDVIRYSRASKTHGLKAGDFAVVQAADRLANRLRVIISDGCAVEYDPRRLKGVQTFHEEARDFAQGEQIQFRAPHRELGIANGQFAIIAALDPATGAITLRTGRGREFKLNLKDLPHLDHGYAVTSHSSQGATVDQVIVNVDTTRGPELVNRQQFYVSISRARYNARVFTDSREALPHAVSRQAAKAIALDVLPAVRLRPEPLHPARHPEPQIITLRERLGRRPAPRQTRGIKI